LAVAFLYVIVVDVQRPVDTLKPVVKESNDHEIRAQENVDQKQHEKFTVPKANAIINPRAVMVHVKYTSITS